MNNYSGNEINELHGDGSNGDEVRRPSNKSFCTIGYASHSVESLIGSLSTNGVQVVIDVRQNAVSRKKGFSKTRLCDALLDSNIAYIHMPDLGAPKNIRDQYRATGDIAGALTAYERYLTARPEGLRAIIAAARLKKVCLLCLETDHKLCHRGIISQKLSEIMTWNPIHL